MGFVTDDLEILVHELVQRFHVPLHHQSRQAMRGPGQLFVGLMKMVRIKMRVTQCVDELAGLEPGDMRYHVGQQRIGCDIDRNTEEDVSRSLIQLARQLAVSNIELEQAVAWRQSHPVNVGRIPGCHDQAARVRCFPDTFHHAGYLVDCRSVARPPGAPQVTGYQSLIHISEPPRPTKSSRMPA